jgi:hypothetical protein
MSAAGETRSDTAASADPRTPKRSGNLFKSTCGASTSLPDLDESYGK